MSGQSFESLIEKACEVYKFTGRALIHKIPTPWIVSYDKYSRRVKNAKPKEKSSVDFEGVWHGRSVAFEAKSTRERTRLDLRNIQLHQMDYLKRHLDQGGISFFLVEFAKMGEVYYLTFEQVQEWWAAMRSGGRKSIPYSWIQMNGELVLPGRGVILDFLKILETERDRRIEKRTS